MLNCGSPAPVSVHLTTGPITCNCLTHFCILDRTRRMPWTQCLYQTIQFSSLQLLNCARLFATPWTAAPQASLSITSRSLLKLMSIESVMPSNHLILYHPLFLPPSIFPSIRVYSNESSGGQRIGASASTLVLPMNIQDWFPLGWTGWISLLSKGLSKESSPTPQLFLISS